MAPPYTPMMHLDHNEYFPEPYSLDPLPSILRVGLIPVGVLATVSVGTTLVVVCFISYRLIAWKLYYDTFLGYNQYVLLVLNLLIADLQQSAAFLFSFHWIRFNRILAPSAPCFAQGWLLHSGDVSSGFFVLAIAVHTFFTAVYGKRIGHRTFTALVLSIWAFAYFLTGIGLALHGRQYFVRAGAWCWVSEAFESDRLAFHYVWVFLVQFGTVLIYVVTFFMLRHKTKRLFEKVKQGHNANMSTILAINRITKLMTLYPCVYVIMTLPLSAGRMWSYAHGGKPYSPTYACIAGCLITSCGWVDSLLYTLTRRRLLKETMTGNTPRRSDEAGNYGILHTRTITVDNGRRLDSLECKEPYSASTDVSGTTRERPLSFVQRITPPQSATAIESSRIGKATGFRAMVEDDPMNDVPLDNDSSDDENAEGDTEEGGNGDRLGSQLPVSRPKPCSCIWDSRSV